MKLFLTCFLLSTSFLAAQVAEDGVAIPDKLKNDFFKLQIKTLKITDQFKQLQLAQQDLSKQFVDIQPQINVKMKELEEFCKSHNQEFVPNEDLTCTPKKPEVKKPESKPEVKSSK